jgi:hypothetical protein
MVDVLLSLNSLTQSGADVVIFFQPCLQSIPTPLGVLSALLDESPVAKLFGYDAIVFGRRVERGFEQRGISVEVSMVKKVDAGNKH